MSELMRFEEQEVVIEVINGEPMFEIYSVGMALGYVKYNTIKGVTYTQCRKDRVNKTLESAEISTLVHDGLIFITESQLYDFMLEARTDKCKAFRKWVTTEVLPQIRATGGYIPIKEDDSDEEIMAKALMISQRTLAKKDEIIKTLQPKAKGYDLLMDSRSNMDFSEFVKSAKLKMGRNLFIDVLRTNEIIRKKPSTEPLQKFIDAGYFEVIQTVINGFSTSKTLITKKGVDWLIKKCVEWELIKSN